MNLGYFACGLEILRCYIIFHNFVFLLNIDEQSLSLQQFIYSGLLLCTRYLLCDML